MYVYVHVHVYVHIQEHSSSPLEAQHALLDPAGGRVQDWGGGL